MSERGAPLSVAGYQRMVARAGEAARFTFLVHSHMLRHSCGYKVTNDGQDTPAIETDAGHLHLCRSRYRVGGQQNERLAAAYENFTRLDD